MHLYEQTIDEMGKEFSQIKAQLEILSRDLNVLQKANDRLIQEKQELVMAKNTAEKVCF